MIEYASMNEVIARLMLAMVAVVGHVSLLRGGQVYLSDEKISINVQLKSTTRVERVVVSDWQDQKIIDKAYADDIELMPAEIKGQFGAFRVSLYNGEEKLGETWFARLTGKSKPTPWCGTGIHGYGNRAIYEQIARAGIGIVRNDYLWPSSEKEKGVYRENRAVQKDVAAMRELGIVPHMILNGTNKIYENPVDHDAFSSWIRWALKADLKDVDTFEIWNESWNNYFGRKFGSYEKKEWIRRFVAFSKAAAQTLHEVSPNANVMVCAEDGSKGLQWMMEEGIAGRDDIVSFHPYVHSKDPRPERRKFFFADEGESLRAHGKAHGVTRFRATEMGWTTYSLNADGSHEHWFVGDYPSVTYEEQANYLIRAYLISRSCGLEAMMQYDFRDDGLKRNYTEHNFGLVFRDLTPKPSFAAVAFMTRLLGEARPLGRIGEHDRKMVRQYAFELSNRRKAYAMWAVENPVEVDVPTDVLEGFLFDLMGNRSELGDRKRMTLTESPVYLVERKK